jgi:hypothetical protein
MIEKRHLPIIALGLVVGVLGYWTADFSKEEDFSRVIYTIMGPGTFIASIIAFVVRKKSPIYTALLVSLGVMLGMLSRIFFDIIKDPSSHNLFPFELMIGLVIVLPAAFLGVFLVQGIFFVSGKN